MINTVVQYPVHSTLILFLTQILQLKFMRDHTNPLKIMLLVLLAVSTPAHATLPDSTFLDYIPLSNTGQGARILQSAPKDGQASTTLKDIVSSPTVSLDTEKDKITFGTVSKEVQLEREKQAAIEDTNQQVPVQQNPQNLTKIPATDSKPLQIKANQVNSHIVGKGFKVDNGVSYQRIHISQLEKKYLFLDFKLAQKDKWQNANMSITIQGNERPIMLCSSTDMDSCYLTRYLLKKDVVLFIQIQCQQDCSYGLQSRWSDLEHLLPGQELIFMFGEDKNQLFHVELDNEQFSEVRIHLSPRATRKPFDNVKMYGKYGSSDDPTEQKYDFTSVNLWQDGQGIFLTSSLMKSKEFTLLIVGQGETTYRLICELVKEKIHILQNNQHIYEYMVADSVKNYHVKDINTEVNDEFSIKFSVLSGNAKIQYFTNQLMTNELAIEPAEYMKDSEYLIAKEQIVEHAKDGIYIRVQTFERDATYTLKYVGRSIIFPVQLNEHIYTFLPIGQKERFCYFNFKNWIQQTETEKQLKFTVSMIDVFGKANPSFRVCKSTLEQCVNPATFNNFTSQLSKISDDFIGEKRVIEFVIPGSLLTKINSVEEEANILVKLQSATGNVSFVALEFLNNNKVLYLREGRPLEQKFAAGQGKFYKYINSDPDVSQIRIHINQIAGVVQMQGVIKSGQNTQSNNVSIASSTIRYTKSLNEPIVLILTSATRAIVGITMQVIHKSDQHENNNIIVIGQDLIYNVKIQPQTYTIFEVVPIFFEFQFLYSSSQSVIACILDIVTNKCIDSKGKEIVAPTLSTKQKLTSATLQNKKARVKITNPFVDSVAEVTIIFHSRSLDQCENKKIGKVYHELVENSKCYSLLLEERGDDLQIYISKREFSNLGSTLFLCGNSIQGANTHKFFSIKASIIAQKCAKSLQGHKLTIQWNVKSSNNTLGEKVKVDFLAQYKGAITLLPEGVGYRLSEISKNGVIRKFGFIVLNKITTKVIVTPIRGFVSAYAKIIKESDRQIEKISNVDFKFESSMMTDYRQEPIITITEEDYKQAGCIDCLILIAVYSFSPQGSDMEFDIQVVQKVQSLSDNVPTTGYLQANSYAYYTYEVNRAVNSSYIFVISDHNERCINLYLGLIEYPTSESKLAASHNNFLVYNHVVGEQRYFLTAESTKVCEYSLSVMTKETSIFKLQRGKQVVAQLRKGDVQLFTFDHYDGPFKIFALSRFGDLKFYLNQSSIQVDKKDYSQEQIAYDKFTYKSEQSNVITVHPKQQIYCTKCSYFLAVQALKNTYSTLFLAYTETIIPLIQRKYFSDYFQKKGDLSILSYKKVEKTQLQVTVHKGQIEINIFYKETRFTQTFIAKSQHQTMVIDVKKDLTIDKKPTTNSTENNTIKYVQRIPINIIVSAKSDDTTYTLQALSLEKESLSDVAAFQDILAGEPNHIKISSDKVLCLNGYYREKNEQIIIHTNHENQKKLSELIVDAKVGKSPATLQKKMVKNMLTLNVTFNASDHFIGASYEICLKSNDTTDTSEQEQVNNLSGKSVEEVADNAEDGSFKAIVTQVNTVNLLPSDTEFIAKGTSTLTINHDGQFLLEVFECQAEGQAKIQYGKSLNSAQIAKNKTLESIGIEGQQHAIKISQEDTTTYVIVNSNFSVVRWLPIDAQLDEGTGYIKYKSGDFRYTSKFKHILVEYQPLQNVKFSKAQMKIIEYTLLISNDFSKLGRVSRCDKADPLGVMVIPLGVTVYQSDNQKQYRSYEVDKVLLEASFPADTTIFMSIVAKMTMTFSQADKKQHKFKNPSSDEHEHYRFIYNRQQMPLQSYKQSTIETIPYHFILLIVLSIVGVLLLFTYLFTRKIIPMLARLKNSNMVEEKDAQVEPEMAEVPPSSDRNQRATDVVIETEDKFGK